jgi:hypothetical protein
LDPERTPVCGLGLLCLALLCKDTGKVVPSRRKVRFDTHRSAADLFGLCEKTQPTQSPAKIVERVVRPRVGPEGDPVCFHRAGDITGHLQS